MLDRLNILVERISDAFSCTWDIGTECNQELARELQKMGLTNPEVIADFIEEFMHLDTDDAGMERIKTIVREWQKEDAEEHKC